MDGGQVSYEIRDFGGKDDAGEEGASEMERCAAVDGDSIGGCSGTWLRKVHGCGVETGAFGSGNRSDNWKEPSSPAVSSPAVSSPIVSSPAVTVLFLLVYGGCVTVVTLDSRNVIQLAETFVSWW